MKKDLAAKSSQKIAQCETCKRVVDRYNVGIRNETISLCINCWAAAGYKPTK